MNTKEYLEFMYPTPKNYEEDPNTVGERFRLHCFLEETGCYSCFDLHNGFRPSVITPSVIDDYFSYLDAEEINGLQCFYDGRIWVAWHWDGDGDLLFYDEEDGVCVVNSDCKKDYVWKYFEP